MRVLQTVASTDRRGAEIFGANLGRSLQVRGHAVRTMALAPGESGLMLQLPTLARHSLAPSGIWHLRRIARGADIVVGHGSRTLPANALATLGLGVPVIYRSIGDPAYWASSRLRRARAGVLLRRATVVVVVWGGAKEMIHRMYGIARERIRVIPRGVPDGEFSPPTATQQATARQNLGIPSSCHVVAYLGSLSAEKNPSAAIRAVARLDDAVLVLAGDGPLRTELEALASRLAADHVKFLGQVAEPSRILAAADALILPSYTEGTPGVLIEAGLMEVPAVATAVGGVPEIIDDGQTGVLVPPDNLDALIAALREVLRSTKMLGQAARRRCQAEFELGPVTDAWEHLLEGVARPPPWRKL